MPFIKTAIIRDEGAEDILHFGAIKLRVNGNGNLIPTLYDLDDQHSQILLSMIMSSGPGREPLRLSNFITQGARLKLETTAIDETMKVNRIIVFVKGMWSEYPGV